MKTLLLTSVLFLSFLSFSQKLIIHVFERQEMVSFSKTTIDSVLTSPDYVYELDTNQTTYLIDLDEETSTYFSNGKQLSKLPIKCKDLGDGFLKINILEDGFDYGVIVNTDPQNESITWFWFTDEMTTVKKISKFVFEKSS
jgi:hypothetical protein